MLRRLDLRWPLAALTFIATAALSSSPALATPPSRMAAGLAFDPGSQRLVLFGGLTQPDSSNQRIPYDDTWEWTGRRWVLKTPAIHPSARAGMVMVTEKARNRILLFGGTSGGTDSFDDTWTYTRGEWTLLDPPASPPGRRYAAGAYDPAIDRVIVFGGVNAADETLTDTWEFDGTTWRQLAADGPKLTAPTMAVDEDSGERLLIGIELTTPGAFEGRTYRWNGSGWTRLTPATQPRCVAQSAMVWQEHNGEIFLHGGACPDSALNGETFRWTGEDWAKVTLTGTPGIVFGHAMAYDPVRQETILHAGTDLAIRSTTYRFRNGRWTLEPTAGLQPGARSLMVFETATFNGETTQYLFGGLETGFTRTDLWKLEGDIWRKVTVADGPEGCGYPVGAFDPNRSVLVIVCQDERVWEFNGTSWKKFETLDPKPSGRQWASMEYDPVRRNMVMYGGYDFPTYLDETWTWNGIRWTEIDTRRDDPDGRALTSMFWDPITQKMMMFGGIGRPNDNAAIQRYGDMWSFDGTRWTEVTPSTLPPIRYGAAVAWDPTRGTSGAAVMFGGKSELEVYLNEEWEWNGTTWRKVESANTPSPRMNSGFTWDPVSMALVHYGGYAGRYFPDLLWLRDGVWQYIPFRPRGVRGVPRPGFGAIGGDSLVARPAFD